MRSTVGLFSALVLRRRLVGRRRLRTLVLTPWAIPGVVATVAFVWMLDRTYGALNHLLRTAASSTSVADLAATAVAVPVAES